MYDATNNNAAIILLLVVNTGYRDVDYMPWCGS